MKTVSIRKEFRKSDWIKVALSGLPLAAIIMGLAPGGWDAAWAAKQKNVCALTAKAAFKACQSEAKDDYWIAFGKCSNLANAGEQAVCMAAAKSELAQALEDCGDQQDARLDVCADVDSAAYDPQLDPGGFVDPANIGGSVPANPYWPLTAGSVRRFETLDGNGNVLERITVSVTGATKEIEYPSGSGRVFKCAVVRDLVEENAGGSYRTKEDTLDWFAQDTSGNVWYFGEIAQNFEDGELVDLEGSWKAGREGAKPGVVMWFYANTSAQPPQMVYRQEFLLGEAEDIAEFIGFIGALTVRGVAYNDVLKTKEYSPLDPDVFEFKYYAPGVGVILEEAFEDDAATGEKVELVP
jgi:hypothetical protein